MGDIKKKLKKILVWLLIIIFIFGYNFCLQYNNLGKSNDYQPIKIIASKKSFKISESPRFAVEIDKSKSLRRFFRLVFLPWQPVYAEEPITFTEEINFKTDKTDAINQDQIIASPNSPIGEEATPPPIDVIAIRQLAEKQSLGDDSESDEIAQPRQSEFHNNSADVAAPADFSEEISNPLADKVLEQNTITTTNRFFPDKIITNDESLASAVNQSISSPTASTTATITEDSIINEALKRVQNLIITIKDISQSVVSGKKTVEVKVYDSNNKPAEVKVEVEQNENGQFEVLLDPTKKIKRGDYQIEINIRQGVLDYNSQQKFNWGGQETISKPSSKNNFSIEGSANGFRATDEPNFDLKFSTPVVPQNAQEINVKVENINKEFKDFSGDKDKENQTETAMALAKDEADQLAPKILPEKNETESDLKIETQITKEADDSFTINVKRPRVFLPGAYRLSINAKGDFLEQDFSWGVLAVNVNKSVYQPGENAHLMFALLDSSGTPVCGNNLRALIIAPDGSATHLATDDKTIRINPGCADLSPDAPPDYDADYQITVPGRYEIAVDADPYNSNDGEGRSIQDHFLVDSATPFDIERIGPTRIYPINYYPFKFNIISSQNWQGSVIERVPIAFDISDVSDSGTVEINGDEKVITWNLSLSKDQKKGLSYTFKAPLISPEFYLLGPLELGSQFQESRAWQIASDAITNTTCNWDGSTDNTWGTAANWSCNAIPDNTCSGSTGTCYWVNVNDATNNPVQFGNTNRTVSGVRVGNLTTGTSLTIGGTGALTVANIGTAATNHIAGTIKAGGGTTVGTINLDPSSAITCLTTNESASLNFVGQAPGVITSSNSNCTWAQNGNVTMTNAGTLSGSWSMNLSGSFTNYNGTTLTGTMNMTGGTFTTVANSPTVSCNNPTRANNNFYNFTAAGSSMTTTLSGSCKFSNIVTVNSTDTLVTGTGSHVVNGNGTSLVVNGTFTATSGNIWVYDPATSANVAGVTYSELRLGLSNAVSFTLGTASSQTITVNSDLTIGDGSGDAISVSASTNNPTINIDGDLTLLSGGTFIKGSGTLTFTSGGGGTSPSIWKDNNTTKQDMGAVSITDSNGIDLASSVTATSVNVGAGASVDLNLGSSGYVLTLTGSGTPLVVSGALTEGTNSTVAYTSTANTNITAETYYNLTLAPSGAGTPDYTLGTAGSQTIDVDGALIIGTDATKPVTIRADTWNPAITVAGDLTLNASGSFTKGSGTLTFNGSGTSTWTDSNTTAQDIGAVTIDGTTKTINLANNAKVTSVNVVDIFGLSSNTLTLTGSGTPFVVSGTFNENTGTVAYTSTANTNITAETYWNLTLAPSGAGTPDYTLGTAGSQTIDVDGALIIGTDATKPVTIRADTWNPAITVAGDLTLNASGSFTKGSGTLTFNGTGSSWWADGNTTAQDMGAVTIDGTSKTVNLWTSVAATSVNVVDIFGLNSNTLTLTGSGTPFVVSGTFNETGTVAYTSASATNITAETYWNLTLAPSGAGGPNYTLGTAGSQTIDADGALTIGDGTNPVTIRADTWNPNITVAGNLTLNNNTTFTKGSGTLTFNGTSTQTWRDNNSSSQDMGAVAISGLGITNLGSSVAATSVNVASTESFGLGSSGYTLALTGFGTPLTVSGTLNEGTNSTVAYTSASATNITAETYWNLTLAPSGAGSPTYTLNTGTVRASGNLLIGDGTNIVVVTADTNDPTFDIDGNLTISANASLTAPSAGTTFTVGGSWSNAGTFTHNSGTVTFNSSAAGKTIGSSGSGDLIFYKLSFIGGTSSASWTFNNNATTTDNFTISSPGSVIGPSAGHLAVGGSWSNSSTFTHNNCEVKFDATATGKTLSSSGTGNLTFYAVDFNSSSGGWTAQNNATSTNNWKLNSGAFTANSGVHLEVDGQFSNLTSQATTWTNSFLYLNSGSAYTINSKTAGADTYGTLEIGANTDIRMWDSSASSYNVSSSGSLYSMDHAGASGDLAIYGDYHIPSGSTDYWNYAEDFDGTASANRQVEVSVADSATINVDAGTVLQIIGINTASTTATSTSVTGSYGFTLNNGTLNAQYYKFGRLNASGLNLTGASATITNLARGEFDNSAGAGASDTFITVAGAVITNNAAKTFAQCKFDNSNGNANYNVTATGTTASSWTFSSSYGDFDGETYNSDPGGDPGYIRWDDSTIGSLSMTASTTATFSEITYTLTGYNNTGNLTKAVTISDSRSSSPGWTVNLTSSGWSDGSHTMDYDGNGSTTGQLCVNLAGATAMYAESGSMTGVSLGTTDCFSAGSQIDLATATVDNGIGTYWIVDSTLSQFIPAMQSPGSYTTTLIFTAS